MTALRLFLAVLLAVRVLTAPTTAATAQPAPAGAQTGAQTGGQAEAHQMGAHLTGPHLTLAQFDAARKVVSLPDGIDMAYIDIGPRDGRPVILVHGYTDSARDWFPALGAFSPHDDRLIIVDLRGHGRSSKPACCYALVDFAWDIHLLMDRLGVQKADLVGHSLGSMIVQVFGETWPERVRHVVLISSTGGPSAAPTPRERAERKTAFDFRTPISQLHDPIDPNSAFMRAWWSSPTPVDPEFLSRQREDSAHMPAAVWLAVLDQGLTGFDPQPGLARLKAPCLLIWGEKDPIMVPEVRHSLIAALPGAQVAIYPGLGHNPFWEQPNAVIGRIDRFLSGL
ncbi:alpha/beta hydrolase [Acetobacter sp. TBRC 12305]|uniref:Alpha/beta hydrolase n=1 Tax=Acetobacter garciniae TaxID=2817435 RepID=A0A939HPL4_9PROT|nr:alpha/beta hydrolase [Acetobacter garciniae]MBO1324961.1 alpha/beta hydrolase [Acetobacter garciniae]MBX0344652.1 alpha/beta hydrolase [Acetobacter garciniae]